MEGFEHSIYFLFTLNSPIIYFHGIMPTKNVPTLRGVFPEPKSNPKRDFIRENKLNLKIIQKSDTLQQLYFNGANWDCTTGSSQKRKYQMLRACSVTGHRIGSSCSSPSRFKNAQPARAKQKVVKNNLNCHKGTQTDDINDEMFLTAALKKCSVIGELSKSANFSKGLTYSNKDYAVFDQSKMNLDEKSQPPINESQMTEKIARQKVNICCQPETTQYNCQLSSSSKQNYIGHFGQSKQEVKDEIPKMEKDNCPDGYYELKEEDRQIALKTAETRFKELIDELNRMPMSSETLRVRNRKIEIEKDLIALENSIRTFSQSKVFIKEK